MIKSEVTMKHFKREKCQQLKVKMYEENNELMSDMLASIEKHRSNNSLG